MALPLLIRDSLLMVSGPLESAAYVAMTEDALQLSKLTIPKMGAMWAIPGQQRCHLPKRTVVEGDWSNTAFFLCMGALSKEGVTVEGLNLQSSQGDRGVLDVLRRFGAEVTERGGDIVCCAHDLKGRRILLPFPSVGATENAMLAACAAAGETVICNAAREPEILDLQCYLRKLGARISGAGTSTVTVSGFRPQPFVEHTIMPDRIVAATILCAGAACGGDVELQGVDPDHFLTVLDSLSEAGCAIIKTASTVRLTSTGRLTAPRPVVTQPYPGFPTDAQPPLMAACLKAKGTTVFTENIFTNRYRHAEEFRRLGAAVSIEGRVAYVTGVDRLTGAPLTSSDLRGGAAMIVAGLSAEGETEILDNGYINRGYDRFDACLSALGADVRCAAPR